MNYYVKAILFWLPFTFGIMAIRDLMIEFLDYDISMSVIGGLLLVMLVSYFQRQK